MYDKKCKDCGTLLSGFYHTFMLGCPNCYKAFRTEINAAVKKAQGATFHVGKAPKVTGLDRELVDEYSRLIKEKERAGLEGRFSDMHELSVQILELAEELKRRGLM